MNELAESTDSKELQAIDDSLRRLGTDLDYLDQFEIRLPSGYWELIDDVIRDVQANERLQENLRRLTFLRKKLQRAIAANKTREVS
jgi:hypothetical protein